MKRLFFALWPEVETRQRCAGLIAGLKAYGKPVAADNIHITLLFLGNTDSVQQQALMQAAATLAIAPMTLKFDQLSYWKKPAVLCLTSRQFDLSVTLLAEQLRDAACAIGMTVDERAFKPHVTLLRKARPVVLTDMEPLVWRAHGFCLVESCSRPDGVEYRVLKQWSMPAPT